MKCDFYVYSAKHLSLEELGVSLVFLSFSDITSQGYM